MYSKQEETILRKKFWTNFGQYLAPIPSAEGSKINWVNYKTGLRFIHLKMDAVKDHAYIGIEISHINTETQELYFNHFKGCKSTIEKLVDEKWIWENGICINGKKISRIYQMLQYVNIYQPTDWPKIISFLKSRIIALDGFWVAHKEIFKMLN